MKTHWLLLVLLGLCGAAHADRDIVYSARYYTPPGSHRTSHFHIYRINPDGTGRMQLTFGSADEEMPTWTPDGEHITFLENTQTPKPLLLCEMDSNGGRRRVLKTVIDNPWPVHSVANGYRLENIEVVDKGFEQHILVNLKTGQHQTLGTEDDTLPQLLPMPGHGLVYADDNLNSTVGTDYLFYQLNPNAGTMHYLTEGQFLVWASDGSHFCTAPGRGTDFYTHRPDGTDRTVWTAPLYVRATSGGKMRQLTPRLSYVTGADWRHNRSVSKRNS